jgi:hypothetical protein
MIADGSSEPASEARNNPTFSLTEELIGRFNVFKVGKAVGERL